jgi:hypothetical protein
MRLGAEPYLGAAHGRRRERGGGGGSCVTRASADAFRLYIRHSGRVQDHWISDVSGQMENVPKPIKCRLTALAQYSISPCLTAVEGLSFSCIGPVKCGTILSPSKIYAVIDGLRMTHSPSHTLLVHPLLFFKKIHDILIPSSCKLLLGPNRGPS